jgi:hypothetical protein
MQIEDYGPRVHVDVKGNKFHYLHNELHSETGYAVEFENVFMNNQYYLRGIFHTKSQWELAISRV